MFNIDDKYRQLTFCSLSYTKTNLSILVDMLLFAYFSADVSILIVDFSKEANRPPWVEKKNTFIINFQLFGVQHEHAKCTLSNRCVCACLAGEA